MIHESLRVRNYVVAFEEALAHLKRDPSDREVRHLLARALAHEPNPRLITQLNELGDVAAREILREAYQEKPSAKRVVSALARSEIRAGTREPRLIPILRTALQAEPDDPEFASCLAECLWRAGRDDEGAEVDRQILSWMPDSIRIAEAGMRSTDERFVAARQAAIRLTGYYARHNIRSPEAIKVLWQAYDLGVCADEAVVFLAHHLAVTGGKTRREFDLLAKALELQPHDTVIRMALMRTLAVRGDLEEPFRWCLSQLRQSPGRRSLRDFLAELIDSARPESLTSSMLGQLRGLCSAHPDDRQLARIAARAHQAAGVTSPQVREIFERAFGDRPDNPDIVLNLARSYLEAGQDTRAEEHLEHLLELQPDNDEAVTSLARLLARHHRHSPDALRIADAALSLHPDDVDLNLFKAELLLDRGDPGPAAKVLRAALNRNPDRARDFLNLAERFRQFAAEDPEALLLLARLYIQTGEPDDALVSLDALQSLDHTRTEEVLPLYDELVTRFPDNSRSRMERALARKRLGRLAEARQDLESLANEEGASQAVLTALADLLENEVETHPPGTLETLRRLASLRLDLGEEDAAIAAFRQILDLDPQDPEARMILGRAALAREEYETALKHVRHCPPDSETAACLRDIAAGFERARKWDRTLETLHLLTETGLATVEDRARSARLEQRARQERAAQTARQVVKELPPAVSQRYEVLQQIPTPSTHPLYRAFDRQLDEVVALKIFQADTAESKTVCRRFLERARAVAALHHPRLVRLVEVGAEPGNHYIAMEYVTGGDLAAKSRLARGPLSILEVRRLALELAAALDHLHSQGINHGRLQLEHVLYDISGRIKLTGLVPPPESPWFSDAESAPDSVEPGGLPKAPEYDPASPGSPSVDIFGFGALLYSVVVGQPHAPSAKGPESTAGPAKPAVPATSGSTTAGASKPDGVGSLPSSKASSGEANDIQKRTRRAGPILSALIARCLAHDPARRPSSFRAISESLESV
jgi:serine/threonine-protein kinase